MGNQEHRLGSAAAHLQQQLLHLFTGEGIEGAKRFVHQQHARIGRQRTGQPHALFLPARQLPDPAFFKTRQIHHREHFAGPAFAFVLGDTRQFKAEADVGQYVLPRQEHVILKHHAAFGAWAMDRRTIEGDTPAAGFDKACNQVQQRRFTAARRAECDQQLLRAEVDGNVRQHRFGSPRILCADALQ